MDINALIQLYKSQGWNDEAAIRADINAGGWQSKVQSAGYGSADSILGNSINAIAGSIKPPTPYSEVNPFSFDEELAKKASTAEYEPYYKELLTDYTARMDTKKSRSQEDVKKTIDFLAGSKEYYTGTARRLLDQSIRKSNEGYEGKGLYLSGASQRDVKQLREETGAKIDEYIRQQDFDISELNKEQNRLFEDVKTDLSSYERDINREKKFQIESGVLKRKSEAMEKWNMDRSKYYETKGYLT